MGDQPWFIVRREDSDDLPDTNGHMVQELVSSGSLKSEACVVAMEAVDRQHFWPPEGKQFAYADMPLKSGKLHLSAPHIYAKALESLLPLERGMSFLNVGSGTGYFNSIISELLGPLSTNHGVEIWPETLRHAERCCGSLGKHAIKFTLGNVYQLDVNQTIRYDRIYLGACANSRSKYLYRLLEVGGILIGPFQVGYSQQLRRVVRRSETQFSVEVLGQVQFASLVEPDPAPRLAVVVAPQRRYLGEVDEGPEDEAAPPRQHARRHIRTDRGEAVDEAAAAVSLPPVPFAPPPRRGLQPPSPPPVGVASDPRQMSDDGGPVGLPGVPFTFALSELPWSPDRHWLFPGDFRRIVMMSLSCKARDPKSICLPSEIWVKHVFPWCPKWWFDIRNTPKSTPQQVPQDAYIFPDPMALPRSCKEDSDDEVPAICGLACGSDSGSTRAPSSLPGSAQTTPDTRPSRPPTRLRPSDEDMDVSQAASSEFPMDAAIRTADEESLRHETLLFEVFGNGHRHPIGGGDDPDDLEYVRPRSTITLEILQTLARADPVVRRRLHEEDDLEPHPDPEEDEEFMADALGDEGGISYEPAPEAAADDADDDGDEVYMEVDEGI